MKILGFDLGDGESCVSLLDDQSVIEPRVIPLFGQMSVLTAVGYKEGRIVIGEEASVQEGADQAKVRFKSRYLTDPTAAADIRAFAQGVASELFKKDPNYLAEAARTVVGCPAGWGEGRRQQYAALMESAGFRNVCIVPESRAAFLYARHARGLRVETELMQKSAIVIDVGSSTTDFAYIIDGHQQDQSLFGDANLGGGVLDELILESAVESSPDAQKLRSVFEKSSAWRTYCELEARRLKEKYFLRTEKSTDSLKRRLLVCYDETLILEISLSAEKLRQMIEKPVAKLGGRSFSRCLSDAMETAVRVSQNCPPAIIIVTGGASRMEFLQNTIQAHFPKAKLVFTPEPESTIAKGLTYAGLVDENLRVFRQEVASITHGDRLAKIVNSSIYKLYEPIAEVCYRVAVECAEDAIDLWKHGGVDTLDDLDKVLTQKISEAFAGDVLRGSLTDSVKSWLEELIHRIEDEITELCIRCGIPPEHMVLDGMPVQTGVSSVKLSLTGVIGMDTVSGLMGIVFAAIGAAFCGGGGLAMVSAGPVGLLTGAVIGILLALLGHTGMEKAVRRMRIPVLLRKLVTKSAIRKGLEKQKEDIKRQIITSLADPTNGFSARMTEDLGNMLEQQMEQMAKTAEMLISA